jgi:hypothetical protein
MKPDRSPTSATYHGVDRDPYSPAHGKRKGVAENEGTRGSEGDLQELQSRRRRKSAEVRAEGEGSSGRSVEVDSKGLRLKLLLQPLVDKDVSFG